MSGRSDASSVYAMSWKEAFDETPSVFGSQPSSLMLPTVPSLGGTL